MSLVIDGLVPWSRHFLPPGADLARVIERYRGAGVDHISLTAASGRENAADAMARIGMIARGAREAGAPIAVDRAAIEAAKAAGNVSVSVHFQSATPFADNLDMVDAFYAAGIRRALLAYNTANPLADGCHEERNAGLSALGRTVCRLMDEVGMRVDLSHCSERTAFDVLDLGLSRPPLVSHSNARALYDHERNVSDDLISAVGVVGGTVGVNGIGFFLGNVEAGEIDVVAEMARHAAHIANLIGEDNVTLGSDFMFLEGSDYGFYLNGRTTFPRGYPPPPWRIFQPEEFTALRDALAAAGFSPAGVAGVLGETYAEKVIDPA